LGYILDTSDNYYLKIKYMNLGEVMRPCSGLGITKTTPVETSASGGSPRPGTEKKGTGKKR